MRVRGRSPLWEQFARQSIAILVEQVGIERSAATLGLEIILSLLLRIEISTIAILGANLACVQHQKQKETAGEHKQMPQAHAVLASSIRLNNSLCIACNSPAVIGGSESPLAAAIQISMYVW